MKIIPSLIVKIAPRLLDHFVIARVQGRKPKRINVRFMKIVKRPANLMTSGPGSSEQPLRIWSSLTVMKAKSLNVEEELQIDLFTSTAGNSAALMMRVGVLSERTGPIFPNRVVTKEVAGIEM